MNLLTKKLKTLTKIFKCIETSEGDGAIVNRVIGTKECKNLDPFLLLDFFSAEGDNGFPDHPHRGFETVTYMLSGKFFHEDFKGHKGQITAGDVQWMTAGKGIVHSEMPDTSGENKGFQLWINLPKEQKLCEPLYQEIKCADFPVIIKRRVYY